MSGAVKQRSGPEALVLGVGNVLWADEGFGVRAVEAFEQRYEAAPGVDIMDGGTQGLALVNLLAETKRLLIFDAVDFDQAPGTLIVARGADVPRFAAGKKMSLHQTSMMEILALAELMADGVPDAITLVGCQPLDMEDYGGGLTAPVAAQVDEAVHRAAEELADWGLPTVRKADDAVQDLMPAAMARALYESQRPDAQAACRVGDDRILTQFAEAK